MTALGNGTEEKKNECCWLTAFRGWIQTVCASFIFFHIASSVQHEVQPEIPIFKLEIDKMSIFLSSHMAFSGSHTRKPLFYVQFWIIILSLSPMFPLLQRKEIGNPVACMVHANSKIINENFETLGSIHASHHK